MATFLLEVGTEELPASFVASALEQWRSQIPQTLGEQSLSFQNLELYGTPRRLAMVISDLPERQPDQTLEVKGPPAQAAFKEGQPTQAAVGFARSRGVDLESLEVRSTEKGDFVFVSQTIHGRPTAEILTELVPQWISGLEGKRFMCWGDGDLRFSRPIRWLVVLLEDQILPLELISGSQRICSDRRSWGHRVLHPGPIEIDHAADYVPRLEAAWVDVSPEHRRTRIEQEVQNAATSVEGEALLYPDLLAEVINLVEWPAAVVGKFDPEFLDLPAEVIVTEMVSHQRYFPVQQKQSQELLPYFIAISNGDPAKGSIIAAGNERVIRARLSDGKFFYQADRAKDLEAYVPRLEAVTFQQDLGSMLAKVHRIQQIADWISEQLQVGQGTRSAIQRAAYLCKADLVTQMVGEFPELQGIMGQKYALTSGEPVEVATAIYEHYLPRGAEDQLPRTLVGQTVGIADRLDTLVSIFGLGMLPTGSSDPFALRRAANAIVSIIWAARLPLNLARLLKNNTAAFVAAYYQPLTEDLQTQLQDFFLQRMRSLLQEEGIDHDLVNAVLGENDPEYSQRALRDLPDVRDRALFLQKIRNDHTLAQIYETVNRAARLAAQGSLETAILEPGAVVDPQRFQQPSEQAFYEALVQLVPQTEAARHRHNYDQLYQGLREIAPTVSRFFDGPDSVLVMDSNPDIRQNRLNLLGLLRNHARVLADFNAIVKS